MQIGSQLRRIRQSRKMTLADVSGATHLSIAYLSKVERDLTEPTLDALSKLAAHYSVALPSLLIDADTERSRLRRVKRPGFSAFVEQMNGKVDWTMQNLLLQIDTQAIYPAETKDDWMRYYYITSSMLTGQRV